MSLISVKESPGKGRGVFAERNLKRGEDNKAVLL